MEDEEKQQARSSDSGQETVESEHTFSELSSETAFAIVEHSQAIECTLQ